MGGEKIGVNMNVAQQTAVDPMETASALSARFAYGAGERDREWRFPHEQLAELKRSDLARFFVPREEGGLSGSVADFIRITAILAKGDSNIAQMYVVHAYCTYITVVECEQTRVIADEEMRRYWQRRIVADGLFFTNAYSERGTKTVFEYKTTIRPTPEGDWTLNGTKFYCTGSLAGDVIAVVCVPEGEDREEQTDLGDIRFAFVDSDSEGVTIRDDWLGMGQRTTASGTIEFTNVFVPGSHCYRTEAMAVPESIFAPLAQGGFTAIYVGIAAAALDAAVEYVKDKSRPWPHSGVERAAEDPYVLQHVGQMRAMVSSAEATLERAATVVEDFEASPSGAARARAAIAIAEAKAVATEVSLRVAEMLFQICGAGAAIDQYNLSRFWRDARTLTLHDPIDYKYRLIGDYVLNDVLPPVTGYT